MNKYKTIFFLFLIIILQLVLRQPFLAEPLERDEGVYGYMAQRINAGDLPYRDVFDHKPPVVYYLYAAAFNIFPDNLLTVRLLGALASLISLLLLFFIGRRLWGEEAGLIAAFLYAIFSVGPYSQGTSSNTEVFMMMFLLASFLSFLKKRNFATGLLAGAALMTKLVAVFNVFALFVFLLYLLGNKQIGWRQIVVFSLATVLVPLAFVAYFLGQGILADFWSAVVTYNLNYVSPAGSLAGVIIWPWRMAKAENGLIWLLGGVGVYFIVRYYRKPENYLVLGWLLASLLGLCAGGHFYGHYFIQIIPVLVLLSAFTIAVHHKHQPTIPFLLAIVFLCYLMAGNLYPYYSIHNADVISLRKYPAEIFPITRNLAYGIQKNTKEDDYVFFWGAQPEVYFYAQRRSPSRFTYDYPLYGSGEFAKQARGELLRDLQSKFPQLIIKRAGYPWFPELQEFVTSNYRKGNVALPLFDLFVLK
ncbi:MAG: glycosyltransferase family 39 protein [bacterium]